jgi:hypothetical protein
VQIGAFSAQFGMNIIFFLAFAVAYRLLMYFFDIQLNYRTLDLEGDYSNDLGITVDESSDGLVTYDLSQTPNEIQQEVVLTPKGLRLAKSKGIPEESVTFPKIKEDGEYTIFDFNVSDDDED